MTRHLIRLMLPAAGLLAAAGQAAAQYPYPYPTGAAAPGTRPPLSPYLNLLNGPSTPGVNYYNFVRPQQQMQQQQFYGGGQMVLPEQYSYTDPNFDPTARLPREAGLPTNVRYQAFNNYGGYFNSMGTFGAPVAPGGQGAGRGPIRR